MKIITTVVIATALLAVSDVSMAAKPAAIKAIQPQARAPVAQFSHASVPADKLIVIREAGQKAQQQILRDALQQSAQQTRQLMQLPLVAPVSDELIAVTSTASGPQLAVK